MLSDAVGEAGGIVLFICLVCVLKGQEKEWRIWIGCCGVSGKGRKEKQCVFLLCSSDSTFQ